MIKKVTTTRKMRQITLNLPADMYEKIQVMAEMSDRTTEGQVRYMLQNKISDRDDLFRALVKLDIIQMLLVSLRNVSFCRSVTSVGEADVIDYCSRLIREIIVDLK